MCPTEITAFSDRIEDFTAVVLADVREDERTRLQQQAAVDAGVAPGGGERRHPAEAGPHQGSVFWLGEQRVVALERG